MLGELTPLKLTFNEPPAATVEELALTVAVAATGVGVGVATGVGVTFGVGVAVVEVVTVIVEEVAMVVNPLFRFSRNSYTPAVVGNVTDTVPELKAVEP